MKLPEALLAVIVLLLAPLFCRGASNYAAQVQQGQKLADSLRYREALEYFRPVAKQYAVASSADKETCLEALYGSVDANIHLTNFMAAYKDLITIQDIVDNDGLPDAKLHLNLGRLYIVLGAYREARNHQQSL